MTLKKTLVVALLAASAFALTAEQLVRILRPAPRR